MFLMGSDDSSPYEIKNIYYVLFALECFCVNASRNQLSNDTLSARDRPFINFISKCPIICGDGAQSPRKVPK